MSKEKVNKKDNKDLKSKKKITLKISSKAPVASFLKKAVLK